jgi:hypothetical protein
MNPDPGGPKTCGSNGSGTLVTRVKEKNSNNSNKNVLNL